MSYKQTLIRNCFNALAPKLKRKVVVFESDDWGSIRMPSKKVHQILSEKGIVRPEDMYAKYDAIETNKDLEYLFEILTEFKDINGQNPVITANCIFANPDFEKIKDCNFQKYYWESVESTVTKHPNSSNILNLWKEGKDQGVFFPQLHGREHLNVTEFIDKLQKKDSNLMAAFDQQTFVGDSKLAAAFGTPNNAEYHETVIKDAMELFEKILGYTSKSFIAPNYTWDSDLENILNKYQIRYIQGTRIQNLPAANAQNKQKFNISGSLNKNKQKKFIRNGLFEPSLHSKIDHVAVTLKHIENAFLWNTPAIISTHRLNFIGAIEASNRDKNLILFQSLLKKIVQKWPDVEFKNTVEMAELFNKKES